MLVDISFIILKARAGDLLLITETHDSRVRLMVQPFDEGTHKI